MAPIRGRARCPVFDCFGPDPSLQLYGRGIRRRLASMIGDQRRPELAYSLLLSLPGAAVIRYGEEIGMGENLRLKDRDAIRTPMQWSNQPNAGFSSNEQLVRPVITDGPYRCGHVNVDDQLRQPQSLLRWMMNMIRIRKRCPEIGDGDWQILPTRTRHVLAVGYTGPGGVIVCAHNLDENAHEITLDLARYGQGRLQSLIEDDCGAETGDPHRLHLGPYAYDWYRLK